MDAIRDEIATVSARLDQRRSSIERRTKRVATVAASFALAGAVLASAMIGITALLQGRRSAERLRLVEETRDLTLDAAGLGTWEWDWRTERITLSARTASLFALPANTPLPPKTVFSAIRADAQDDAERALRGAGEHGGCDWEGAVGQHPASSRVVHLRAGLYRDGAGRPTVLRGVAQDVTFRREAEQRARELDVELLHAGRLSTVGETAAATAHELSQPLSAASTFVQSCHTILRSGMDYDRDEMVAILARGLDALGRASDIVRNLRRFLRKEAPATEQVDLNSAVRDAVPLAAIGFERRANGRLMWDLAGGVPTIEADKTQIQQVVVNLVRNAIDAMADSPVRELRIGTEQINGRVRLSVADTGPGLPEEIREAPFRPFKTTKPNGLGLGLSISKSIVEAHGGTIEVASGPHGTVFSVDLPSSSRAGDGNGD
jgi:C4-dicarboxylate-specific signal transduction histidine kinase